MGSMLEVGEGHALGFLFMLEQEFRFYAMWIARGGVPADKEFFGAGDLPHDPPAPMANRLAGTEVEEFTQAGLQSSDRRSEVEDPASLIPPSLDFGPGDGGVLALEVPRRAAGQELRATGGLPKDRVDARSVRHVLQPGLAQLGDRDEVAKVAFDQPIPVKHGCGRHRGGHRRGSCQLLRVTWKSSFKLARTFTVPSQGVAYIFCFTR